MPQLYPRLFSDDGVDSDFSRYQPHTIYYPDASTIDSIKFLFSVLQQLHMHQQNSTRSSFSNNDNNNSGIASNITTASTTIDIQDFPFLADLSLLAPDDTTKLITVDDVCIYMYVYVYVYLCLVNVYIHVCSIDYIYAYALHACKVDYYIYHLHIDDIYIYSYPFDQNYNIQHK